LIDIGVELGMVRKSGSWFAYGEERIGQGREKAMNYLAEHPDMRDRLRNEILSKGAVAVAVVASPQAEA
jgi:recombination protein RecA